MSTWRATGRGCLCAYVPETIADLPRAVWSICKRWDCTMVDEGVREGVNEEDNSASTTRGDQGGQLWWARTVQRHPEADKCSPALASHRLPPVASETLPCDAVALVEAAVAPW
ncbi:hypothetical protein FB451DRAFT_1390746 [Mycena latifolia]|nr:hypothetical protein FB451DRAFT_1390746 [Mycena latifolia]